MSARFAILAIASRMPAEFLPRFTVQGARAHRALHGDGRNRRPNSIASPARRPIKIQRGRTLVPVWKVFLIAFSVLLPIINPLGSALVFLGLVGDAPPKVLRSLAWRIAINNIVFLAVFEVLGAAILKFFGISLPIVQLSGGMVVAAMGWNVLNERSAGAESRNKEQETGQRGEPDTRHLEEGVFYPYTFPVTSGPGTLVALLTVTAHISNKD